MKWSARCAGGSADEWLVHEIGATSPAAGMVGKAAVIWLLLVAVLGVAAVDAVSIAPHDLQVCPTSRPRRRVTAAAAFRGQGRSVDRGV